jgi:Na+/melibiose symporter-like transporter
MITKIYLIIKFYNLINNYLLFSISNSTNRILGKIKFFLSFIIQPINLRLTKLQKKKIF